MDEHKQTCSIGPETPWSKKKYPYNINTDGDYMHI